jgi:hypothetical protein
MEKGKTSDSIVIAEDTSCPLESVGMPLVQLGPLSGIAMVKANYSSLNRAHVGSKQLEQLSISIGPVAGQSKLGLSLRDQAYVKDVCFGPNLPSVGAGNGPFDLLAKVEKGHGSNSIERYYHIITYRS